MKTCDEINLMTLTQCNEELGAMAEYSLHNDVNEAREALRLATARLARYKIYDGQEVEEDLCFEEAVGVIADWWENCADFAEIEDVDAREEMRLKIRSAVEAVEAPEMLGVCDICRLREYAGQVCQAVALAVGCVDDFDTDEKRVYTAAENGGFCLIVAFN